MSLGGEILKNISYRIRVETIQSQVLSDAQVEILLLTQIKLLFGQFNVPFNLEDLASAADLDTSTVPKHLLNFKLKNDWWSIIWN